MLRFAIIVQIMGLLLIAFLLMIVILCWIGGYTPSSPFQREREAPEEISYSF